MSMWRRLQVETLALAKDLRGNVIVTFAVAMPALLGMAGLALDYANLTRLRSGLQQAADGAALVGAREMRLANVAAATVQFDMNNVAASNLKAGNYTVSYAPTADLGTRTARITLTATAQTYVIQALSNVKSVTVSASSAAQIKGGDPICVIGLNTSANFTVKMDKSAQLQAPNCVVYSNSTKANGLMAMNSAKLSAAMICSAGGATGSGGNSAPGCGNCARNNAPAAPGAGAGPAG